MTSRNKYRILVWVIGILVATNLSMGISFMYHKNQERQDLEYIEEEIPEAPARQRTRFFREQLNLSPGQVEAFRILNRDFNRRAWQIQHRLAALRLEMVNELGQKEPNRQNLDAVATRIGELHQQLKMETIEFYLAMKKICTEEQQEKLHQLFLGILGENEDVRLPQGGGRNRSNRWWDENELAPEMITQKNK